MKQSYHTLKTLFGVSTEELKVMLKYYPPGCKDLPEFLRGKHAKN